MKPEKQALKHLNKLKMALDAAQNEINSLYHLNLKLIDVTDYEMNLEAFDNQLGEMISQVEDQIEMKKSELELTFR
jgi:hypothetical protein